MNRPLVPRCSSFTVHMVSVFFPGSRYPSVTVFSDGGSTENPWQFWSPQQQAVLRQEEVREMGHEAGFGRKGNYTCHLCLLVQQLESWNLELWFQWLDMFLHFLHLQSISSCLSHKTYPSISKFMLRPPGCRLLGNERLHLGKTLR